MQASEESTFMVYAAGKKLGNYRLLKLLGTGGFADVYLGEHIYLKTSAAIKVLRLYLDDAALDQFLTEARTIARLKHRHIVSVHDFGIDDGDPFLVMDYAAHGSLRGLHPLGSVLALTTLLTYIKPMAEALQYAHEKNIIHCDVKPENMLLDGDERLLLSDFGIALTTQSMPDNPMLTKPQTMGVLGTATYMAPEAFISTVSFLSDQYSLGIAAYEWLCGKPPFSGSDMEIALQHINEGVPPLHNNVPDIPPTVEQVIMKALAKQPQERYPSILDFSAALEQAIATSPMQATAKVRLMLPVGNEPATSLHIRALNAHSRQNTKTEGTSSRSPSITKRLLDYAETKSSDQETTSLSPMPRLRLPTKFHPDEMQRADLSADFEES
jgi:serine/threonine protein kinase